MVEGVSSARWAGFPFRSFISCIHPSIHLSLLVPYVLFFCRVLFALHGFFSTPVGPPRRLFGFDGKLGGGGLRWDWDGELDTLP